VPLTPFQKQLLADLTAGPPDDLGYLAGGAALHFEPNSVRFSRDLDFFHDSVERVAAAFERDSKRIEALGYTRQVVVSQPGFVRAVVTRGPESTRVDWAHDSAWRFMPLVRDSLGGLLLHPVDLAVNKVLALVGRDEPRDFVDALYVHKHVLPLGALCWAAVGKDPGFTPLSLLELLRRQGRYRPEDFARLDLVEPFDLVAAKHSWRDALDEADAFCRTRPPDEIGCLYWQQSTGRFIMPPLNDAAPADIVRHYGTPGGVLPDVSAADNGDGLGK
jgi:hypothetical protein